MTEATQFAQQFAARAEKVNPSAPSNTNWSGVEDLLAEELGLALEDVYVSTVSKPGNVSVRFGQSNAALAASVIVAMHTDKPAAVERTIEAMRRVAEPRDSVACIATCEAGAWTVVALVARSGDKNAASVSRCYPDAVVLTL